MEIKSANEFGPLDAVKLSKFKSKYAISLPPDYEEFLLKYNGGEPDPSDFDVGDDNVSRVHGPFYGLHRGPKSFMLDSIHEVMSERVPPSLVPVASDAFGNQICIAVSKQDFGCVFFWDHEAELQGPDAPILLASSFSGFLNSLYRWEDPDESPIDRIIKQGTLGDLKAAIAGGIDVESKDEYDRTMMERAAIQARNDIILYLHSIGANLGRAIHYAKENAQFFDEHKETLALLQKLQEN